MLCGHKRYQIFPFEHAFPQMAAKAQRRVCGRAEVFDSVNAAQRLGDYLLSEKRYYDAFKVFHKAGDMNKIEYCLQGIFSNKSMKLNLSATPSITKIPFTNA